jgi:hypothetical protein
MSQSRQATFEFFEWVKQHGTMRKTKNRCIARVAADFLLNLIAYDLICIPKPLAASLPRVKVKPTPDYKTTSNPPRRPNNDRKELENSPVKGLSAECWRD